MTTNSVNARAMSEPWMRGTHSEVDSLRRGVVHALELSLEDADRWASPLTEEAFEARPSGLPSVGFHLRHVARSLDRLLTYAEARSLNEMQRTLLQTETVPGFKAETSQEFREGVAAAIERILGFTPMQFEEPRGIGRLQLPTTVGGLLVHCAEHTQRHLGQMVTTAKLVASGSNTRADQRSQPTR